MRTEPRFICDITIDEEYRYIGRELYSQKTYQVHPAHYNLVGEYRDMLLYELVRVDVKPRKDDAFVFSFPSTE